jgi:nitrogen fixation NifU-like protein
LTSAARALYREAVLEHSKKPRNFGVLPHANRHALVENPLCGDKVTLHVRLDEAHIADIAFEGEGCAIALASASMMSESIKGRSLADARRLTATFARLVRGELKDAETAEIERRELGPLCAFAPVSELPARVECACLAWRALGSALDGAP